MESLAIYVIYDHPKDYPNNYVVKRDLVGIENPVRDQTFLMVSPDLALLRNELQRMGLTQLSRDPNDNPVILEYWL